MNEPVYHLDSVVRARAETLEDFDGPLDVILLLLSKNKIEIQDVSITAILEQYRPQLVEVAEYLLANETMTAEEFEKVFRTE